VEKGLGFAVSGRYALGLRVGNGWMIGVVYS